MARRNYLPPSALNLRDDGPPEIDDHHHRVPLQPRVHPAVLTMEDRVASQHRQIQTLFHENQRLAISCDGLERELAAAQQELRRLSAAAAAAKAEGDAKVSEVREQLLRMEGEADSVDSLQTQWARVIADIEKMSVNRNELDAKLKEIEFELVKISPEVNQIEAIKREIDSMHDEIQRGRAAVEHERQMHATNLKQSEVMEKHLVSMNAEIEKLHTELVDAEKKERAAAAAAGIQGPEYAPNPGIHESGYGQSLYHSLVAHELHGDVAGSSRYSAGVSQYMNQPRSCR